MNLTNKGCAEDKVTGAGDIGMDGVGRNIGHAGFLEDSGGGAGRAGIAAGHGDGYAVLLNELLGDGHGFLGRGLVVIDYQFDHLPTDTTGSVSLVDRQLRAIEGRLAVSGGKAGQRDVETDFDGVGLGRTGQKCQRYGRTGRETFNRHRVLPGWSSLL